MTIEAKRTETSHTIINVSGEDLLALLRNFGYDIPRQDVKILVAEDFLGLVVEFGEESTETLFPVTHEAEV